MKCATCQNEATVHIEAVGIYLCASCLAKVDARIAQLKTAWPCPFCGGRALDEQLNDGLWQVVCLECGTSTATQSSALAALMLWNRRTP